MNWSILTFCRALAIASRPASSIRPRIFPRLFFTTRLMIHLANQLKTTDAPVNLVTFKPLIEPTLKFCKDARPSRTAIRRLQEILSTLAAICPLNRKRARYEYLPSPLTRPSPRFASMAKFPSSRAVSVAGPLRARLSKP